MRYRRSSRSGYANSGGIAGYRNFVLLIAAEQLLREKSSIELFINIGEEEKFAARFMW